MKKRSKRKKRSKTKTRRYRSRASPATSVPSATPVPLSAEILKILQRPPRKAYLSIAVKKYGYPPPRFVVIHHLDEDPFNQEPSNLVYLPRHIHYKLHMWFRQGSLVKYADEIVQTVLAFKNKEQ